MSLRIAVAGAGSFGRHHVRILAGMEGVSLVAAVDPDRDGVRDHVEPFDIPLYSSVEELPRDLDAAVVAVPTDGHRAVAESLLERGVALLVEKPLAGTVRDAAAIVAAAERAGVVLATGHVERFHPGIEDLIRRVPEPRRLECHRVAPWASRVLDVGVIFDLMIHDLDLCLALAGSEVTEVEAQGRSVLTEQEDEVRARLVFANGCVAELLASRVVKETERSLRVHGGNGSSVDLDFGGGGDKLTAELTDFVRAVEARGEPRVPGRDGLRAVELAQRVREAIG